VTADLVALADRDDAEEPLGRVGDRQEVLHHRAVALLEDVERHRHARERDRVQREDGHRGSHGAKVPAHPGQRLHVRVRGRALLD